MSPMTSPQVQAWGTGSARGWRHRPLSPSSFPMALPRAGSPPSPEPRAGAPESTRARTRPPPSPVVPAVGMQWETDGPVVNLRFVAGSNLVDLAGLTFEIGGNATAGDV